MRVLLATLLLAFGLAHAQSYPSKPVRIIVPFPPGGPTDLYARLIAQHLQEAFAQPVVVENRPGATGLTGSAVVQQAPADGHTLLFTSNSAHVISPMLRTPHPFEPTRDFTPVAMLLRYPMYLLVNPAVPATTLQEFVAYARARPGKLNYSSVGIGSGGHLACELFNINARTDIVHVPYKGAAPAQAALVAGEAQLMCDSVGNSQALVQAGKLRGLAVTATTRSSAVPDVPTLAEAGVPGVVAHIWLGLLGPAKMPEPVVTRLNAEVARAMAEPALRERVLKGGNEPMVGPPEKFRKDIEEEGQLWLGVIREKGIKAE